MRVNLADVGVVVGNVWATSIALAKFDNKNHNPKNDKTPAAQGFGGSEIWSG